MRRVLRAAVAACGMLALGCVGGGAGPGATDAPGSLAGACDGSGNQGAVTINAAGNREGVCCGPSCGEAPLPPYPAGDGPCLEENGCRACVKVGLDWTLVDHFSGGSTVVPPPATPSTTTLTIRQGDSVALWRELPQQVREADWLIDCSSGRSPSCKTLGNDEDRVKPAYQGVLGNGTMSGELSQLRFTNWGLGNLHPGEWYKDERGSAGRTVSYRTKLRVTSRAISGVYFCDEDGDPLYGRVPPPPPSGSNCPGGLCLSEPNAGPLGGAAGEPVELRYGAFYEQIPGLSRPSAGPALATHFRYSSQQAVSGDGIGGMGAGWSTSYSRRLLESGHEGERGAVWLLSEDGQGHLYVEDEPGSGAYVLQSNAALSTLTPEAGGWRLRYRGGQVDRYDASGALVSVTDRVGNTLTLTEEERAGERVQVLTSSASGLTLERVFVTRTSGAVRLVALDDTEGRRVELEYDDDDRLVAIVDEVGVPLRFGYDALGRVTRVEDRGYDPDDAQHGPLLNRYEDEGPRVLRQTMSNGLELDFAWASEMASAIPGRIEAEEYTSYLDNDSENRGTVELGPLPTGAAAAAACDKGDAVDIQPTEDAEGACNVGWTRVGERLDYTLEATETGTYAFDFRVAGPESGGIVSEGGLPIDEVGDENHTFDVLIDGQRVGEVEAPNLGWQIWETRRLEVPLEAGRHVMSLRFVNNGLNINYVDVIAAEDAGDEPSLAPRTLAVTYRDAAAEETWSRTFLHDDSWRVVRAYVPNHPWAASERDYHPTSGQLVRSQDAEGRATFYQYTPEWELALLQAPLGGEWSLRTYNAFGDWTEAEDPRGRVVTRTFNAQGLLATRTEVGDGDAPRTTSYTYDAAGRVLTSTGPTGIVTTYVRDPATGWVTERQTGTENPVVEAWAYNAQGFVVRHEDARGVVTTYAPNDAGRVEMATVDPEGAEETTVFEYDGRGNVTRVVEPDGAETTMDYVEAGETFDRLRRHTDATGAATTYRYDAFGRVVEVRALGAGPEGEDRIYRSAFAMEPTGLRAEQTAPDGTMATRTHDLSGRLLEVQDPRGETTRYAYDRAGRVQTTTSGAAAIGDAPVINAVTTAAYFADGQLSTLTGPSGVMRTLSYDAFGRLEEVRDGAGRRLRIEREDTARVLRTRMGTPAGESGPAVETVAEQRFDDAGRLSLGIRDPDGLGETTLYAYGEVNRVAPERVTLPDGETLMYEYDSRGFPQSTVDAAGESFTTLRDHRGQVVEETSPGGRVRRFEYDGLGRLMAVWELSGDTMRSRTWERGVDGQPTRYVEYDGQATGYEYDLNGRLVGIDEGDDDSVESTLGYLDNGLLELLDDAEGATGYAYDAAGRLTERSRDGRTLAYMRRADGRVTGLDYFGQGSLTMSYDEDDGLLEGLSRFGVSLNYDFDERGQLDAVSGQGVVADAGYDPLGRVTAMQHTQGSDVLEDMSAMRDARGRRESQTDGDGMHSFAYDAVSRLESVDYGSLFEDTSYEFDALGNRVRAGEVTRTFGAFDHIDGLPYDDAGRLLSDGETDFAYDVRGRLAQSTRGDVTTTYRYDGLGNLVGFRTSDEEGEADYELVLDEAGALPRILAAVSVDSETLYAYGPEGLSAVRREGELHRVLPGLDGSVRTELGSQAERFDVWGRKLCTEFQGGLEVAASSDETTSEGGNFYVFEEDAPFVWRFELNATVQLDEVGFFGLATPQMYTAQLLRLDGPSMNVTPESIPDLLVAEAQVEGGWVPEGGLSDRRELTIPVETRLTPGTYALVLRNEGPSVATLGLGFTPGDDSGALYRLTSTGLQDVSRGGFRIFLRGAAPQLVACEREWGPGYRGQWHNPDGTLFLNARTYHPALGVFLQPDMYPGTAILPQTLNRYAYANGDPVNMWDPSGFSAAGGPGGNPFYPGGAFGDVGTPDWTDPRYEPKERICSQSRCFQYVPDEGYAEIGAARPDWVASQIPGVGELEDIEAFFDPETSAAGRLMAGASLALGTVGVPNFGRYADDIPLGRLPPRGVSSLGQGPQFSPRMRQRLRGINPVNSQGSVGRVDNCLNCAIAVEATLSGNPAAALPSGTPGMDWKADIEGRYDSAFGPPVSAQSLNERIEDMGDGARGITWGYDRETGASHVWNTVNRGGQVVHIDGQVADLTDLGGYSEFEFLPTNSP